MPLEKDKGRYVWMDGQFVLWQDAKIHIASHVIHYGTGVFEGERCYKTKKGPACFRLQDHTDRLFNSAKIYRMDIPFTKEQIIRATLDLIKRNMQDECYIRPIVYRGYQELGVNPFTCPVNVALMTWYWGKYLGPEAADGVDVMVSSWNRMAPNTFPAMSKTCANYMNSQLIKMEALKYGFVEGIALDTNGFVSEGSGENIFVVKGRRIHTPPLHPTILPGITRDTVITLARDLGYEVVETMMLREFLYLADEVFFTGTAAEVTPIKSIDKIPIGTGKPGLVTMTIQKEFFSIINGEKEDRHRWLTYVK
ncbi:MAG: branched-chain amino acid transaminase [candidate division WOR-3 bacterium]